MPASAVRLLSEDWQVREYKSTSSPSSTWLKVPLASPSFLSSFPPSSFPTCFHPNQRLQALQASIRCGLAVHCRLPLSVHWASDTRLTTAHAHHQKNEHGPNRHCPIRREGNGNHRWVRALNAAVQKREMRGASRCLKTRTTDRPIIERLAGLERMLPKAWMTWAWPGTWTWIWIWARLRIVQGPGFSSTTIITAAPISTSGARQTPSVCSRLNRQSFSRCPVSILARAV